MARQSDSSTLNAHEYWEKRLSLHPGLAGVGYLGRSRRFLELQYHTRAMHVKRILLANGLSDLTGRSVLDVGSGTGYWLDFWRGLAPRAITGLDFTEVSVKQLRARFPDDVILRADISESLPIADSQHFDIMSVFDVFLHITNNAKFERALANLAKHAASRSWLIISDAIISDAQYTAPVFRDQAREQDVNRSSRVRTLPDYVEALARHGFQVVRVYPATVILSAPLEAPSALQYRLLAAWWRASRYLERVDPLLWALSPLLAVADRLACRLSAGDRAPSAKVLLARKAD